MKRRHDAMTSMFALNGCVYRVFLVLGACLAVACSAQANDASLTPSSVTPGDFAGQRLLELWSSGQPAFGKYVTHVPTKAQSDTNDEPMPYSIEAGRALARNPIPDFAFLSLEHHYDSASAGNVATGLRDGPHKSDMGLLVRIPPISTDGEQAARERVAEVLAAGANGIVIPHILSLEEAKTALSFFSGVNVWSPESPEGNIIVMLLVEDPPVFKELTAIAELPGYSSLVCGIGSLTQALDGDRKAAEEINQQVLAETRRVGKINMTPVDAKTIAQRIEQGFLGLLAYGETADDVLQIGKIAAQAN